VSEIKRNQQQNKKGFKEQKLRRLSKYLESCWDKNINKKPQQKKIFKKITSIIRETSSIRTSTSESGIVSMQT
jgi:hypothetical protein